eukprot:5884100-Pyramimonas_sp.AAC.1
MLKGLDGWTAAMNGAPSSSNPVGGAPPPPDDKVAQKADRARLKKQKEDARKAEEEKKNKEEEEAFYESIKDMDAEQQAIEQQKRRDQIELVDAKKKMEKLFRDAQNKIASFRSVCETDVPNVARVLSDRNYPEETAGFIESESKK